MRGAAGRGPPLIHIKKSFGNVPCGKPRAVAQRREAESAARAERRRLPRATHGQRWALRLVAGTARGVACCICGSWSRMRHQSAAAG
jgi:hypothetical protein